MGSATDNRNSTYRKIIVEGHKFYIPKMAKNEYIKAIEKLPTQPAAWLHAFALTKALKNCRCNKKALMKVYKKMQKKLEPLQGPFGEYYTPFTDEICRAGDETLIYVPGHQGWKK
mgnify:CR=1 FL=1